MARPRNHPVVAENGERGQGRGHGSGDRAPALQPVSSEHGTDPTTSDRQHLGFGSLGYGRRMAHVAVFHHAQGLTAGVRSFADLLASDGHTVTVPDLYDGATFDDLAAGIAHAREIGFGTVLDRGRAAAEDMPAGTVYIGFSLGAMPAQMLAQTRPGAGGAVLCHACVPPAEFGGPWPEGVRLQIHAMDADEQFVPSGDLDAAREIVGSTGDAELFLYPGDRHLFADSSLADHDRPAADLLTERVRAFVTGIA